MFTLEERIKMIRLNKHDKDSGHSDGEFQK